MQNMKLATSVNIVAAFYLPVIESHWNCSGWDISKTGCKSACKTNGSVILLAPNPGGGAGIGDRFYVLDVASVLARSLCAQLIIPPPYSELSKSHNLPDHKAIQCSTKWSFYRDWQSMQTNVPQGLYEWDQKETMQLGGSVYEEFALNASANNTNNDCTLHKLAMFSVLEKGVSASPNLTRVDSLTEAYVSVFERGRPFMYTHGSIYHMSNTSGCHELIHSLHDTATCPLKGVGPSQWVTKAAEAIVGTFDRFALLHIRRSDTLRYGCNSTPDMVRKFLACGPLAKFKGDFPFVIFFTDETDYQYLLEVHAALRFFAKHVIHGDIAAKEELAILFGNSPSVDNYLVYSVKNELRGQIGRTSNQSYYLGEFGGHSKDTAAKCKRQTSCAAVI